MNPEEEYFIYQKQQDSINKEENFNHQISYFFTNNKFDDDSNYEMWYNLRRFHTSSKKPNNQENDGFVENNRKKIDFVPINKSNKQKIDKKR